MERQGRKIYASGRETMRPRTGGPRSVAAAKVLMSHVSDCLNVSPGQEVTTWPDVRGEGHPVASTASGRVNPTMTSANGAFAARNSRPILRTIGCGDGETQLHLREGRHRSEAHLRRLHDFREVTACCFRCWEFKSLGGWELAKARCCERFLSLKGEMK